MGRIPKVIHYCWFGYGAKDDVVKKCMASWRKYLPDYQVKVWDELSFNVDCNRFVSEAYAYRKWAFVADYVRLHALYTEGGIYLDTDVEVFRPLDEFLNHTAFSGFEDGTLIPTGLMGAEKGNPWIKRLLQYYQNRPFIQADGTLDLKPNTNIITDISSSEYGLRCDNSFQVLKDEVAIYPREFFCIDTGIIEAYATHHFNGSWLTNSRDYKTEAMLYKKLFLLLAQTLAISETKLLTRLEQLNLLGKNIALFDFDFTHNILYQRLKLIKEINVLGYIPTRANDGSLIPVVSPQDIAEKNVNALILTPMWQVRDVRRQLAGSYPDLQVLSLEDFFDHYIMF